MSEARHCTLSRSVRIFSQILGLARGTCVARFMVKCVIRMKRRRWMNKRSESAERGRGIPLLQLYNIIDTLPQRICITKLIQNKVAKPAE